VSPRIQVLEFVRRPSPLGLRFFDPLLGNFVADGLAVTAYPSGQPGLEKRSVPNRSAIHTFHDLPGLADFEFPLNAAAASASLPRLAFSVEVTDDWGRFLPFCLGVTLPEHGLFQLDCAASSGSFSLPSPPSEGLAVSLFSAPARAPAASFARVRAELWDPVRALPAAWALVELHASHSPIPRGPIARGLADEQGRVAIFLPYPELVDLPPGSTSSLFPNAPPLTEQRWAVELAVYYTPELPVPQMPDLCTKLQQSRAAVWADSARSAPLGFLDLLYGRELTVRTHDGGVPLSTLWVTSA
jgi:hypothetical protein